MGTAKGSKDANQSRRLFSLAAVLDGMNRADAARIGGMDRQTLRDWFIGSIRPVLTACATPWANEPTPRLSVTPKAQLADIVEAGPDREVDGVVRWRP